METKTFRLTKKYQNNYIALAITFFSCDMDSILLQSNNKIIPIA
jgi:hypothetical protein